MILVDDHIHTNYSDGKNSPEEMIECAIELGIKRITFTDHVRRDSDWIEDYYDRISYFKYMYQKKIEIIIGVECKVISHKGDIDCPETILKNKKIQKVAAIHRIPKSNGEFIRKNEIYDNKEYAFENYIEALKGLKSNSCVDRIAHPFSIYELFNFNQNSNYWIEIERAIDCVKLPFEYNVKYNNEIMTEQFWKRYKESIVFGSDSHCVEEMKERVKLIKGVMKKLNL